MALAVVEAVAREVRSLNRYPDREFTALRSGLAGYLGHDLTPEQVWAGNGSNEVLQQLVQAFGGPGRTALGFTPAYSMHPIICTGTGTAWVDGQRGSAAGDFELRPDDVARQVRAHDPDVVFLCSPNNPTGTALALDVVEAAYAATERAVVVVDEAYAEFARAGTPSALTLLPGRPRLVVSRTMSKAFALAGARLGYLAASPAVVDALRLVRLPYHLSALTQVVARVALSRTDELLSTVEQVKAQRDRIVREVTAVGLRVVPSEANFLLFGPFDDPAAVWQQLLDRGVLVRDVSAGPGLAGWLRVNAGTEAETSTFLSALKEVLA